MPTGLNAMLFVGSVDDVRRAVVHASTAQTRKPTAFVDIGPYGSQVTVWTDDPAVFRRIGEAMTNAASELDATIEAEKTSALAAPVEA